MFNNKQRYYFLRNVFANSRAFANISKFMGMVSTGVMHLHATMRACCSATQISVSNQSGTLLLLGMFVGLSSD